MSKAKAAAHGRRSDDAGDPDPRPGTNFTGQVNVRMMPSLHWPPLLAVTFASCRRAKYFVGSLDRVLARRWP